MAGRGTRTCLLCSTSLTKGRETFSLFFFQLSFYLALIMLLPRWFPSVNILIYAFCFCSVVESYDLGLELGYGLQDRQMIYRYCNLNMQMTQDKQINIATSYVDPVLTKNRIQDFVPQTKGDFRNSEKCIFLIILKAFFFVYILLVRRPV